MQRKAPDFPLQAGDLLYIPDNKNRRAAMTTLDRLANFGGYTMANIVIWH